MCLPSWKALKPGGREGSGWSQYTPLIPASNRERVLASSSQPLCPELQSIKWVPLSAFVNVPGVCHFFFGYGAIFLWCPLRLVQYYEHEDVCVYDSLKALLILEVIYLNIFLEMTTKSEKKSFWSQNQWQEKQAMSLNTQWHHSHSFQQLSRAPARVCWLCLCSDVDPSPFLYTVEHMQRTLMRWELSITLKNGLDIWTANCMLTMGQSWFCVLCLDLKLP